MTAVPQQPDAGETQAPGGHARFDGLARAHEQLLTAATRNEILRILLDTASRTVDANGVAVVLRGTDEVFHADRDSPAGAMWLARRFPLAAFLASWAMLHRRTVVIEDAGADPRVPAAALQGSPARAMVLVPVGGDRPYAAIGAYWSGPHAIAQGDVAVLEALARAAGATLQQRDAADKLRASDERYRTLAEMSAEGILIHVAGRYVYANPAALRLFGALRAEDLSGARAAALAPELEATLRQRLALMSRGEVAPPEEVEVTLPGGECVTLEVGTSPLTWDSKPAVQVLLRDVSERKRAETAVRASEQRYRALIKASSHVLYHMNADLSEMYLLDDGGNNIVNGHRGSNWMQHFVATEDRDLVMHMVNRARARGDIVELEHRVKRRDGSQGWVYSRAVPIRNDAGEILEWFGMATDITERKLSEEALWQRANFDPLTGLPNRRLFRDRLDQEVAKALRTSQTLALLFIDLDRFKEVNDLLGHGVGDNLLIEAAKRIDACVRKTDTVARLGGDEFTAILTNLPEVAHVEITAQKIIDALVAPFHLGDEEIHLSASVGITILAADADNAADLIRNADQAMYAAKNAGRNQFNFFTPSMQQEAHNRLRLIGDLRSALKQGQFEVHYQPVIALATGATVKAEALLRWRHPRHGLIDPTIFIPYAEESGLIVEIGDWVFEQAAACAQRWTQFTGKTFQIGVNRSPVQFRSRQTQLNWSDHLHTLGMAGASISVEITEGMLLQASPGVSEKLMQLREAGIEVAIDDFGTGYSSMAYLKKFNIDYLKIDQSFIHDMAASATDRAIVKAMIMMAHELDLRVIAEGVETEEQQRLLIDAGCDYGQGFLYSRAVPAAEFESALRTLH
jgi:diguanylate cyclase (GGDEF)-like protein/PAS domain S-box-containing protein